MTKELIQETLESVRDYLPKLISASETIAQDIQAHQEGWLETFIAYSRGLEWLTSAISGIKQIDPELLETVNVHDFVPLFDQLTEAFQHANYVTVCDLLLYEVKPLLEGCFVEVQRTLH